MKQMFHSRVASPEWIVLVLSLPPRPSSLRVRAWRKLRELGAVALRGSVYLLPAGSEHAERMQWLAQELARDGGEATLMRVERFENVRPEDLIRLFHEARGRDYGAVAARLRKLLAGLGRRGARRAGDRHAEELRRLDREIARIRDVDFFDAPARLEVERLRDTVQLRLAPAAGAAAAGPLALDALQGRRWVTRPRPHVDRIGSAWLISRFIDPRAEFVFAPPAEFPSDAIPYDAVGAELGHQGDDCTFETLLKRAGLRDPRLAALAEIVHEADLRDGKYPREEARGLDHVLRALLAVHKDDHEALAAGMAVFDGLYANEPRRR